MRRVVLAGLLALGVILLLSTGCGIFSSKSSSPTGISGYTGQTGSLVFNVIWPVNGVKSRTIPPEATVIEIEVTGEGMAQARKEIIQLPETQKRIDNLPIGEKGVTAIAKDQDGHALASGFASVVVEPNKVKDVTIKLTPIEQSDIALARAMIQDVRDAGVAMDVGLKWEIESQLTTLRYDLVPVYALTLKRLDFLRTVLTKDVYSEEDEIPHKLRELSPATYQAKLEVYGWAQEIYGWWVVLKKVGDAPAPETWVVKFPQEDGLTRDMELTFKYTGSMDNNYKVAPWQFDVVSSSEPQLQYHGTLVLTTDDQKRLTKAEVNGSFKDKYLPDGITVKGTLEGEPAGQKSYTKLVFSGSITSPKVSLTIEKAEANFAPPTPDEKYWGDFFTSGTITNLNFKTQNVEEPIEITGNLKVEAAGELASSGEDPVIKKGTFSGRYISNNSTFSGSISFDWQNPHRQKRQEAPPTPIGTANVTGQWQVINRPIFQCTLNLNAPQEGKFSVDIDLSRGDHYLRGKLDGTWEWKVDNAGKRKLKVVDWSFNLTNENKVRVQFSKSTESGVIFGPSGNKVADIQKDPDLKILLVKYVDGTVESLQPISIGYKPTLLTGTVKGRVVDKDTGKPIEWAWVWSGWDEASTDQNGKFEVKALAGHQTIRISCWGYDDVTLEVDVPAHGTVDVGTIQLPPWSGAVKGIVVDGITGTPIEGAEVWWTNAGVRTYTDQNGQFVLKVIPGNGLGIEISKQGYEDLFMYVDVPANTTVDLGTIQLFPPFTPGPPPLAQGRKK